MFNTPKYVVLVSCLSLTNVASAWDQIAYTSYIDPLNAQSITLENTVPSPYKYLGQALSITVYHTSSHRIECFGPAYGTQNSCTYTFTNEGGSKSGTDSFNFGFTGKHVVLGGSTYTLIKPKTYSDSRPLNAFSIPMRSVASTDGHFSIGGGSSTGLLPCNQTDPIDWSLLVPGMLEGSGGV